MSDYFVGVDIGVRRISVATTHGIQAAELDLGKPGTPRYLELRKLAHWLNVIVCGVWGLPAPDTELWVERTFASNGSRLNQTTSLTMAELVGAIMTAATWSSVTPIVPSSWKAGLLKNGRADKDGIDAWLLEHYPQLFRVCGTQDERDAMCLSLYGRGRDSGEILAPMPKPKPKRKPRQHLGDPYTPNGCL